MIRPKSNRSEGEFWAIDRLSIVVLRLNKHCSDTKSWRPPPNISVYLSKIELPDLNPGRLAAQKSTTTPRNPRQSPAMQPPPPPVPRQSSAGPGTSHTTLRPPSSTTASARGSRQPSPKARPSPTNTPAASDTRRPSSSTPTVPAKPRPPAAGHLPPEPEPFGLGSVGSKIAARLFSSK